MKPPRLTTALAAAALAGPAAAQSALVLPPAFTAKEAPGASLFAFSPFAARRQLLLDGALLGQARGKQLEALWLRRSTGSHGSYRGGALYLEVFLSHAPRGPAAPSMLFAANRGRDWTRVFAGLVQLAAPPASPTVPAPWSAPQAVRLGFARAFRYTGGPLLLEVVTRPTGTSASNRLPWWPVDSFVQAPGGAATAYGNSCFPNGGLQPAGAEDATLHLGGTAVFHLAAPLPPGVGLFALGTSRTRFGSLPLPFPLDRFGAKGCSLYTDWLLLLPSRSIALQVQRPGRLMLAELPLPARSSLAGARIYGQFLSIVPRANPLNSWFSNGVEARLGLPPIDTKTAWIESNLLGAKTGRIILGRTPVLKIDFR